jgi:predicted PurR-regulated permease PerM
MSQVNRAIDIALKLGVLVLIGAWCFQILSPFINPVLWGIILAVALEPVFNWFMKITKARVKLSAILLTLVMFLLILIPAVLIFESAISGFRSLKELAESGELALPSANPAVKEWPVIGDQVYGIWDLASTNIEAFLLKYEAQLTEVGRFIFDSLVGTGAGMIQLVLALIIAGVLLATPGTKKATEVIFQKIAGSYGHEFVDISRKTIQNVVKGILGVSVIQALLVGIGFYFADVPYPGLWAILVLILGVIQLPPALVIFPVIGYVLSEGEDWTSIFWSAYILLAGASDNILKPLLMGRGAAVPMLVIFLGSLGGFIAFGFIGLFVGAIVLSLAYKILLYWMKLDEDGVVMTDAK